MTGLPVNFYLCLSLAEARASFCGFLSIHFRTVPDEKFITYLGKDFFCRALDQLKQNGQLQKETSTGASFMLDYIKKTKYLGAKKLSDALGLDRTQLYRGMSFPRALPPPYEELWVPFDRKYTKILLELSKIYRDAGFQPLQNYHDRLDYLGIELEYFHQLLRKETLAWEAGDRAEALEIHSLESSFFQKHLVRWVPNYTVEALKLAKTDFYRGHLHMLNGFLKEEEEVLLSSSKGEKLYRN